MQNQNLNKNMQNFLKRNFDTAPIIQNDSAENEQFLPNKQGLIERVDRTLKTQDGRILLMEQR